MNVIEQLHHEYEMKVKETIREIGVLNERLKTLIEIRDSLEKAARLGEVE